MTTGPDGDGSSGAFRLLPRGQIFERDMTEETNMYSQRARIVEKRRRL